MKLWNFPTHNKWFDEPEVMGFLTTTLLEVDIPAERCWYTGRLLNYTYIREQQVDIADVALRV